MVATGWAPLAGEKWGGSAWAGIGAEEWNGTAWVGIGAERADISYLCGASAEQIFSGSSYIDAAAGLTTLQLQKQQLITARDTNLTGAGALTISALKAAAAPRALPVYGYVNGSYIAANRTPSTGFYPTSAYMRSANDPTKYLMDTSAGVNTPLMSPTSAAWQADRLAECQRLLALGFDSIMFDNLGWAASDGNEEINADGTPTGAGSVGALNPATGLAFTAGEVMAAWQTMVGGIRTSLGPGVKVMSNGLGNGVRYYDTAGKATTAVWGNSDSGIAEIWDRSSTASPTAFPNESNWKKDVDLLTDATGRGRQVFCIVKLWPTVAPTQAQIDQWHRFAVGSFLLGADGTHALQFTTVDAGQTGTPNTRSGSVHDKGQPWYPEWDLTIGPPLQSFSTRTTPGSTTTGIVQQRVPSGSGAYYRRNFAGGVVLVNPTSSATAAISLGGSYAPLSARLSPLDGSGVAQTGVLTSVTLGPSDAAVLIAA